MSNIGINDNHQNEIVNYLRFARYNRSQTLKSVDSCFADIKDSRLEDTYTFDEVIEMLDSLCSVVKGEVELELTNASHTNVLLLRQLFSQAEKWHLKLQADISELENRKLLEEIAQFEENEFSAGKSGAVSFPSLAQSKLQPLNEGGSTALLKMKVSHTRKNSMKFNGMMTIKKDTYSMSEKDILTDLIQLQQKEINKIQEENAKLKERVQMLERKASSALDEKTKLSSDLDKAKGQLSTRTNAPAKLDNDAVQELSDKVAILNRELKDAEVLAKKKCSSIDEELVNSKHYILALQHEIELLNKELDMKFSQTSQYKNLKKMLETKNVQIKDLRARLRRDICTGIIMMVISDSPGPENWHKNFPVAASEYQSPINIDTYEIDLRGEMQLIDCDNKCYEAFSLQFHWGGDDSRGSEHHLNMKTFPMEIHILHRNVKYNDSEEMLYKLDGMATIAVFVEIGSEENEGLGHFIDQFRFIKYGGQGVEIPAFPLASLLPLDTTKYYTYAGSLSAPPCNECNKWIVIRDPIKVSADQLDAFRQLMKMPENSAGQEFIIDNFRPVQPICRRTVTASLKLQDGSYNQIATIANLLSHKSQQQHISVLVGQDTACSTLHTQVSRKNQKKTDEYSSRTRVQTYIGIGFSVHTTIAAVCVVV
eukprot:gene3141-3609_t